MVMSEMEADGSSSTSSEDDDDERNLVIANARKILSNSNRNQQQQHRRNKRSFPFSSASSNNSDQNSMRLHPTTVRPDMNSLNLLQQGNHEEVAIKTMPTTAKDAKIDLDLVASSSPLFKALMVGNRNSIRNRRRTIEQWHRLTRRPSRINRMEYFTCRNCSLTSLALLQRLTELKYIDVSFNSIKVVEFTSKESFKHLEILLLSNNRIETLDFTRIVNAWPNLATLSLSNNPIKCSIASDVKYQAAHLRKVFNLHLNVRKCK